MDIATIIGIVGAMTVIVIAILLGGSISQFIDIPSILIVIGGGLMATIIRFPIAGIGSALALGGKIAVTNKKIEPREMIEKIAELADIVRKNGPLGLENVEIEDPMLSKGMQFVADGYDLSFIKDTLEKERDLSLTRLSEGHRVFKSLGDACPAFGMIGTLVGLVQMLAAMDDPSAIGPAMAVALLTTLYGAVVSNVICIPMADKMDSKFELEELNHTLIIDGVLQIRESKSPNLIKEMLLAYLPDSQRAAFTEAA